MTFTLKEKEGGEGGGEEGRQWRGRKRGEKGKEEEKKLGKKGARDKKQWLLVTVQSAYHRILPDVSRIVLEITV